METKTVSKTFNEYEDFNVGDIVRIKSGSCNMTVDGHAGSRIVCVWYGSDDQIYHRDFNQGALEKVPAKDPDLSPA